MSRIEKLSISGVRSFSPAVREAIQFNTPLTLIVGYNGSGKTTIIECLKYATTGELPPNSKGGAFIHDPKLCGEREVMAQVKLQFRSINNRQHVATRSLQLTVKKTSRTQKTLDCSLAVVNNGERTTTSTRQAQLDEMIPERLGVSPAILDAVIFCHQDESLWPLSEPAALKKRFDEIFEAHKYTKVIDNLKVIRKKQMEELARLQTEEAHNKVNKDRGERSERRMTGLQAEIEEARSTCEALSAEMEETQQQIKHKHEQANSFLQVVQNLSNKREQLEYRQEAINELKQTIDQLDEDDASLERSLVQYEQSMQRQRDKAEQNKEQCNELHRQLGDSRRDLSVKLSEQGKHQSDKDKYERQLELRVEIIRGAAQTHGLRGFDGELTDHIIKSFHEKIQKLLLDKRRDFERVQKDNSAELDKLTMEITKLEGAKAAKTQDRVSAKQRIGAIEKRSSVLQNEIGLIDVDQGAKAILDGQLQEVGERLQRAQDDFDKGDWDEQLSSDNDKLWRLESENEKLGRELVECTRLASERAQLDFRKKELSDRKRKLEALTSTWRAKLTSMLGAEWEAKSLESEFQSVQARYSKTLQEARRKRDVAREKQQKVGYIRRTAKESVDKKTENAADCKAKVVGVLQSVRPMAVVDDFVEEMNSVEQQVEDLRNELSLFDALVDYYSKCKRLLESKRICLLCDRHFDDNQGASLDRMSKKIEKHLNSKGRIDVEKDLKEASGTLESLKAVRGSYDTYVRLSGEVAALAEECKTTDFEYDGLERQLEELESAVSTEEETQRDLDDMSKIVAKICQTAKDMEESEAQVERIMSQQKSSASMGRSAEEIHELQAANAEQMRSVKGRIQTASNDRQRAKDHIKTLELERSELNNKIGRAAGQLEKKSSLQSQVQALKEDYMHQRDVMQRADAELERLEPDIAAGRSMRDEVVRQGREREQRVAEARDGVASSIKELSMVEGDVEDYVAQGAAGKLVANERAIRALERQLEQQQGEIEGLVGEEQRIRQELDNADRSKKNIGDNINYRRHVRTLEVLRREIAELERRDAHDDYERLQQEARELENRANRLLAERGSVMGSMKTKDEELGRLLGEWELDYKEARQRYRESHIRVETTRAAIDDLAQCGGAVDRAVMHFHALKMADVNRIADELWRSTYQGTDIDTICIRSDAEAKTGGRRSYNYRLCMVKQDAEMDMRGRCSAGQKVLASIIVRLALAESFGLSCGLVALDEPTTNLDRDNIKSLAESLHEIIRARQAQANFQLIVITHDEQFLRHMRCSDFCDSFYRVKRDAQQNSIIVRESIAKVF
ncbi:hypothetical protein CDD82_5729 [Ophiocordyceps australis]|uniref:DNA repair protein RAD50 n=1 Tax=Ophiocordyceps australis TaxID=1399860 RepID=A0A2C5Z0U1_9HYPO|nr:hypothetical protein CDD82_5729 [Ophiocordyceps australis]